ncbi:MAG: MFS transporter [Candidatus Falkowbacteria bacterium]
MKTLKNLSSSSAGRTFLILSFLIMFSVSFSFATYIPFLVARGMNLWQINVINCFFMATIILMEMPTGSFADKFGRHRSITLSCFISAAATLTYFCANSFWIFILAEIIAGLGKTFSSGALEAWIVDSLKAEGLIHQKEKLFRQETYFCSAGVIIGSLTGSYIGNYNLAWPWLASALLSFLVGLYSLRLKESYHDPALKRVKTGLIKQIKIGWQHGFNSRKIISFMILGAVLALSIQALNMQWTIVFQKSYHLETKYLGWIFIGIALSDAWGGNLSKYSRRFIKDESRSLAFTQVLTALVIIVLTQISGLAATLSFFFLHEMTRGAFKPLKQSYFNDQLLSETRATVLSLDSMINKIGSLFGLLISGYLANTFSIHLAWLASGIFLLTASLIFILPKRPATNKILVPQFED